MHFRDLRDRLSLEGAHMLIDVLRQVASNTVRKLHSSTYRSPHPHFRPAQFLKNTNTRLTLHLFPQTPRELIFNCMTRLSYGHCTEAWDIRCVSLTTMDNSHDVEFRGLYTQCSTSPNTLECSSMNFRLMAFKHTLLCTSQGKQLSITQRGV
jgi:hypothetical protein